jgi:hypothetical protein
LDTGFGLLRIPKQSQIGLGAAENLAHQAACFERAQPSLATPKLLALVQPQPSFPRGALCVRFIDGQPLEPKRDAWLMGRTLAALHVLAVPQVSQRAPLRYEPDPLEALALEIEDQLAQAELASLPPRAQKALGDGRRWLQSWCAHASRPAVCLIAFDAHPGNYVVVEQHMGGPKAYLVDLEKCRYSYAPLDLAHATQYTSTTWDRECHADLSVDAVDHVYERWLRDMPPERVATDRIWFGPLRHAMWLWSLSWCAMWQTQSLRDANDEGSDWSVQKSDAALVAHVRERVAHYLSDAGVARVQHEFAELKRRWPSEVPWFD